MTDATQAVKPVTLKERRERLGLTLRDVEEISKGAISNSYLSQLETGKIKNPSLENARTLATIYHCQTDDIAEALSLPILTALLRCHCCGQSLYNAKFITDAVPSALSGDEGEGWQKIASAPKDGSLVLIWVDGMAVTASFDGEQREWFNGKWGLGFSEVKGPTHWKPHPRDPSSHKGAGEP